MNTQFFVPAITTAVSVGLGCGTCCSPIITTFLSTYVVSHSKGAKKGFFSFLSFFFGKMISVSMLCMISALVSSQFINENGYIGSFNLRLFSQMAMSMIGVIMVIRWFFELKKQKKCGGCIGCGNMQERSGFIPIFMAGITYGITPCAPLLLMIGYCFTMPVSMAGITGVTFSLSSMVSPVLLLVIVSGVLSGKMNKEIPEAVKWFRLVSYILLMVMPFFVITK